MTINDCDFTFVSESSNTQASQLLLNTIEIKSESMRWRQPREPRSIIAARHLDGTVTDLLQTDTKKDYDTWLLALRRTAYSRIGGGELLFVDSCQVSLSWLGVSAGIFGQSLDDTYSYTRDKSSRIPLLIRQCCEYLLEYGSTFVGLFR